MTVPVKPFDVLRVCSIGKISDIDNLRSRNPKEFEEIYSWIILHWISSPKDDRFVLSMLFIAGALNHYWATAPNQIKDRLVSQTSPRLSLSYEFLPVMKKHDCLKLYDFIRSLYETFLDDKDVLWFIEKTNVEDFEGMVFLEDDKYELLKAFRTHKLKSKGTINV